MTEPTAEDFWMKLLPTLNEAQVRWFVGQKALEWGHGGIERVHALTGLSRPTIRKGIRELRAPGALPLTEHVRRPGGGRKRRVEADPTLVQDLEALLAETTAGDPMSALKWTSKSSRTLAKELVRGGHVVSADTIERLLGDLDYSLQVNRKTKEGPSPGRRCQNRLISRESPGEQVEEVVVVPTGHLLLRLRPSLHRLISLEQGQRHPPQEREVHVIGRN